MRILLYGINFAPEPTGIGKYTGEMAAWLAAHGHQVRVVTTPPYYPAWQVGTGYKAWQFKREQWQGVDVWRCPVWVPRKPGGLKRVLHLLSFAAASLPVMLRQAAWKPELVWVAAPAFACTPGALMTARLAGAKSWLHVQDYEVDVAFDTGLLKGQWVRRLVTAGERRLLRRFDTVSSISQRMLQRAAEKGVAPERIVFFPNWVDVDAITPLQGPSPYRAELGISPDAVVALFSGTLSAKQGLHLLPQAARLLAERCPNLVIVICGDGQMKAELQAATQDLPNVRMLPLQPKERLNDLLGMADMHLLPQDPDVADLVMPSKLTAMLSSGRPVVSNAREGSELATVIGSCGVLARPGDVSAFVDAVAALHDGAAKRLQLGQFARTHAVVSLGMHKVLERFAHAAGARPRRPAVGAAPDAVLPKS